MGGAAPSTVSPGDPYRDPELMRFAGGMEGIPDWVDPGETASEGSAREGWRARGHAVLDAAGRLLPGLALAAAVALSGRALAGWIRGGVPGSEVAPVGPIGLAIAAGLAVRNTVGLPAVYELGVRLALRRVLRLGVALLGIRLSLGAVLGFGLAAVPLVAACIAAALLVAPLLARAVGLPRRLGVLVAVGTAICGNSAIAATAPVIGADEDETSYAVGTITLFGLLALAVHPLLAHALFGGDPVLAGRFLGTAIHDTAQVAGAGLLYVQHYGAAEVLEVATVTKLVRNLSMVVVIPLLALHHARATGAETSARHSLRLAAPTFVLGFAAMAVLRSAGDLGAAPFGGLLDASAWEAAIRGISGASAGCLTVAMAAVGLSTSIRRLRGLGLAPLAVGLGAALAVAALSAALVRPLAGAVAATP